MTGMSLVMSKPSCPVYNFGTSNRIDLIPHRLSNLHLLGSSPPVATTRMLKRRAFSLSTVKDTKGGLRSEVPEVSSVKVPYVLLGIGVIRVISVALATIWAAVPLPILIIAGIFKLIHPLVFAFVGGPFLADFVHGFAVVLHDKPFSIRDIIEVGSVKGQVIEFGLVTTSLLSAENVPMQVPNSVFCRKAIVNKSRVRWVSMVCNIFVQVDEIEKIHKISEEIINMMKSNSNVYLEKEQPYCCLYGFQKYCLELTLGCNLKQMDEDELLLVKQDVLLKSTQIIKKHDATFDEHAGEVKGL